MTVCLDTGVFLQIFGRQRPFYPILRALLDGQMTLVVSTEILLEYQEIIIRLSGAERWSDAAALLELPEQLHGNIRRVNPQFRFNVISVDPDDKNYCDCAIAAEADFVVTEDNHFDALKTAGCRPKAIEPGEFVRQYLMIWGNYYQDVPR